MDELTTAERQVRSQDPVDLPPAPFLTTRGLTKKFGETTVVDKVDVAFRSGEIHGLVGQNGAGKSSLIKMICGVYRVSDGFISVEGRDVVLTSPRSSLEHGITMVAQELSLVPALSVADNILLGQEPSRGGVIRGDSMRTKVNELIDSVGFRLRTDAVVSDLSPTASQQVEILRALAQEAKLIVFDEPTSSMSIDDTANLYDIMRGLAREGAAVVLVSHFLDEILDICDVVSVIRDGRIVLNAELAADLTTEEVVRHMTGQGSDDANRGRFDVDRSGIPRLRVSNLSGARFEDVSLEVHPGEVVALVGLVGAGRTEFLRSLFGADSSCGGSIELDGRAVRFRHPSQAVKAGVAMITESRKIDGIFPILSTTTNIAAAHPRETSRFGFIDRKAQQLKTAKVAHDVEVRAASLESPIESLSGGNQQKALFARWLMRAPRLFLIDEPTRGVDVVSIAQIHQVIAERVAKGMSVLMVTSEFEEAIDYAHRIIVFRNGKVAAEFDGSRANEHELLAAAFGTLNQPGSTP